MILPRFDYEAPVTPEAVVDLLRQAGVEARLLAGGTDLLVKMKRRGVRPRLLISLNRVEALRGTCATASGGVRIGSLTTLAELATSGKPNGKQGPPNWTALFEGAASVGGPLIRNRATIGGNIVNARPCADTVPPLIALGATLSLRGPRGDRAVEADGFVTGPGETLIGPCEVLTAIDVPAPRMPLHGSCYLKITRRAAMEVTIVGCAASIELEEDRQTVSRARLVFASVAPVPLRVREAEAAVEGRVADLDVINEAAATARSAARPIDDPRAPASFRAEIVEVLTRRALGLALERAGWRQPS